MRVFNRATWPLLAALAALAAGCGGSESDPEAESGAAAGKTFELRYGDAIPDDAVQPFNRFGKHFIECVESGSNGQITVEYFPNAELGDNEAMMTAAQNGALDFVNLGTGTMESLDKKWAVFAVPFLALDQQQMFQLLESDVGQEVLSSLEDQGLTGLGLALNGVDALATKDLAIEQPEDLEGLKIRVSTDPTSVKTMDALGAQAVPIDFTETYSALQQGVIDGVSASPGSLIAAQIPEIGKTVSIIYSTWSIGGLLASSRTMESLPPDLQETVTQCGEDATQFAKEDTANIVEVAQEELQEVGATVTVADPEPFRQMMAPVYDAIAEDVGADFLQRARDAVSAEA